MNIIAERNKGRISKKREVYSHRISDQLKEERRVAGTARNTSFNGLTLEEKLEKLASAPGESRKQVFKLTGNDNSALEALALLRAEISLELM
jgi:hypothetical protein